MPKQLIPVLLLISLTAFGLFFVSSIHAGIIPLTLSSTGHKGNFSFDTSYNWQDGTYFLDNNGAGADAGVNF